MERFPKTIIELKPSRINGVGIFAAKDLSKNEIVAEGIHEADYNSIVLWDEVSRLDSEIINKIHSFCIGTPDGFFPPENNDFNMLSIDWYMNHSCEGNIGFNENGDFIALRNINKHEELVYDYALAESNPKFHMICNCKSEHCRKLITGNDWKESDFRRKNHTIMFPLLREIERII